MPAMPVAGIAEICALAHGHDFRHRCGGAAHPSMRELMPIRKNSMRTNVRLCHLLAALLLGAAPFASSSTAPRSPPASRTATARRHRLKPFPVVLDPLLSPDHAYAGARTQEQGEHDQDGHPQPRMQRFESMNQLFGKIGVSNDNEVDVARLRIKIAAGEGVGDGLR